MSLRNLHSKITVTKGYDGIRKIEIIRSNAQVFYYIENENTLGCEFHNKCTHVV